MARTVRLATASDAAIIAALNRPVQQLHARAYPARFKSEADTPELVAYFAGKLGSEGNEFGICEQHGEPVGYAWIELRQRDETPFTMPSRTIYVHHISVVEAAQRQGIGSALMDWVDERARELDVTAIGVDHWAANKGAAAFFSRRGFAPEIVVMRKPAAKG